MTPLRIGFPAQGVTLGKYVLFGVIALLMASAIYRDRILLDSQHPVWTHYQPFAWWLLPHGLAAALPLFLGPLQFSTTLRRRNLLWHRRLGWAYCAGVAVSAPVGIVVETIKYFHGVAPLRLLIGSCGLGSTFLVTTGLAFYFARHRQIDRHRRWMARSYAVSMVFLLTRFTDEWKWAGRLVETPSAWFENHGISDLWLFLLFSMLGAELVMWLGRRANARPSRRLAPAAAGSVT